MSLMDKIVSILADDSDPKAVAEVQDLLGVEAKESDR
jgi:hypothetical protein